MPLQRDRGCWLDWLGHIPGKKMESMAKNMAGNIAGNDSSHSLDLLQPLCILVSNVLDKTEEGEKQAINCVLW